MYLVVSENSETRANGSATATVYLLQRYDLHDGSRLIAIIARPQRQIEAWHAATISCSLCYAVEDGSKRAKVIIYRIPRLLVDCFCKWNAGSYAVGGMDTCETGDLRVYIASLESFRRASWETSGHYGYWQAALWVKIVVRWRDSGFLGRQKVCSLVLVEVRKLGSCRSCLGIIASVERGRMACRSRIPGSSGECMDHISRK